MTPRLLLPLHALYAYPQAGHAVGFFVPYEPSVDHSDPSFVADQRDRPILWKHLLAFLDHL